MTRRNSASHKDLPVDGCAAAVALDARGADGGRGSEDASRTRTERAGRRVGGPGGTTGAVVGSADDRGRQCGRTGGSPERGLPDRRERGAPAVRESIRKLTDAEWAVLEPHLKRREHARHQLQHALKESLIAEQIATDMVAAFAGGERDSVELDIAQRMLYRRVRVDE